MKDKKDFVKVLRVLRGVESVVEWKDQNKISIKLLGQDKKYLFRFTPTKGFGNVRSYPYRDGKTKYFGTYSSAMMYFVDESAKIFARQTIEL